MYVEETSAYKALFSRKGRERFFYDLSFLKEHMAPQKYKSIQVVGTNGKGSVSHKIAKGLMAHGYKVGLFTSPHLFHPLERIEVNGIPILEEIFWDLCKSIDDKLTFFDTLFLVALKYFSLFDLDYAVFEAGIGAKLDATTLLEADLSVITNISLDHCDLLGKSKEEIAFEKSFAIRKKKPVVLGYGALLPPILERASKMASPILLSEADEDFDKENSNTARKALEELLQEKLEETKVEEALLGRPFCRFQQEEYEGRTLIFDGAHNLAGIQALCRKLTLTFPKRAFYFLVDFSSQQRREEITAYLEREKYPYIIGGNLAAYLPSKKGKEVIVITGSFYYISKQKEALIFSSLG